MRPLLLAATALALTLTSLPVAAQAPSKKVPAHRTERVDGTRTLEIVDLTPRFLDFYAAAQGLDPGARWKLWDEKYGFAAVPPTPEGMKMARSLLDSAWPRYPQALDLIRKGADGMQPQPEIVLPRTPPRYSVSPWAPEPPEPSAKPMSPAGW